MSMFNETTLGEVLDFYNGKAIKPGGTGRFPAYGSNGLIGGSDEYRYEHGIVIGRVGAYCGSVAYCLGKFWASDNTIVVKPKLGDDSTRFFAYLLLAMDLHRHAGGSAQPLVTQSTLKAVSVKVPDAVTQTRIASILSAYDDLIESNTRRIAILEEMARRLYEEWFVRFRFPGHEESATTGGLPTGWSRTTLGSLTTKIGSGATPRGGKSAYFDSGVTLIRSQNIFDYNFVDKGLAFLDDDQAAQLQGVAVESGDVLLNITGASVARCCMVPRRHLPARVNQHVMIIRADSARMEPSYLLCAINSVEMKRQLLAYAQTGSTREALTREMMSQFAVLLPDHGTLRKFGKIAGDIFRQREILADKNANLRTTRDLLLPKLISGELDVSTLTEPQAETA